MKPMPLPTTNRFAQRGAASLIVVMLLFFVLSLTAAYTSRNLIFEQKTSANQSRSTAAFEAAEAGIEWTLAMLNGGTVSNACANQAGGASFQQRYVAIAPYGAVPPTPPGWASPPPTPASGLAYQRVRDAVPHSELHGMWPTCVFNGTNWDCSCPGAAPVAPVSVPVGAGPFPAFRVWPATPEPTLAAIPPANAASSPWGQVSHARSGFMFLNSVGCTRLPAAGESCLDFIARGEIGEGISFQRTTLALRSGLAVAPAAAVTAGLSVTPHASPAPTLKIVNTDYRSGGFSVNTSAVVDQSRFSVQTTPGTPPALSFADSDPKLVALSTVAPATVPPAPAALDAGERMFVSIFGMKRATYRNQPGLRVCASPCSASAVNTLLQNNPDRIIWVEGDLTVDNDIGSAAAPVLMIVNGSTLTMDEERTIHGFVYLTGDGAAVATIVLPDDPCFITGGLVAEGHLVTLYPVVPTSANHQLVVTYDSAALDRLRLTYGSWVRLGAAWRDFKVVP